MHITYLFFNVLFHTVLCSLCTHRHYASFCLPVTAANMEVVMVNWRKHQFRHVLYLAKCFLCFPQFFHCFFMAFIFGNGTSRVSLIVLRFGVTSCTIHAKCKNIIMFHHQEWSTTKQKQACKTMPKQLQLNAILENRQNTCVYTEVSMFAKKKKSPMQLLKSCNSFDLQSRHTTVRQNSMSANLSAKGICSTWHDHP